ncbi:endonuclease G [Homoserinimonas aerilata]|uniref:Endonuclease G n=1 Tax=Homoserinimonas aerilata TaxID=1162970 RepID=A0A542YEZ2_9MICO|nr:DNA/RNA non-specific endonuclease [Homoserinimonas aerilata]TQL46642.1 endonuclease G [Homoserinimonas aerilata]
MPRTMTQDDAPGYDPGFLGVDVPLPLPTVHRELRRLDYTHFTVLLDPARRLAAATAVTIDGARLRSVTRGDHWHLDERVPPSEQAGPELYAHNDLDRGHLVRRRDPCWGDAATAERANRDSFAYTNAAPQAATFNQGRQLWAGLEDHVLAYAEDHGHRVSVITGPVLDAGDPVYRGVGIPLLFFKVAAWRGPALQSAGFVLDQSPALDDIDMGAVAGAVPPLGPFRTFQVPVAQIEALAGLRLGPLTAADVLARPGIRGPQPVARSSWVPLERASDITLVPAGQR